MPAPASIRPRLSWNHLQALHFRSHSNILRISAGGWRAARAGFHRGPHRPEGGLLGESHNDNEFVGVRMRVVNVDSWADYQQALRQLGHLDEPRKPMPHYVALNEHLLFRGIGNGEWALETTLERSYPLERSDAEVSLLSYYRKIFLSKPLIETMSGETWGNIPNLPEFGGLLQKSSAGTLNLALSGNPALCEYLVYLRHHGFPSPLLDWTASPYVAALFAFDAMDRTATHVAIYAVAQDKYTASRFDAGQEFLVVGPYIRAHPRHYLQQSRYSLCIGEQAINGWPSKDFLFLPHERLLGENVNPGLLVKFLIPAAERQTALKHLDSMNINPHSLFGSDESLMRTVARRECLFKEWGYF